MVKPFQPGSSFDTAREAFVDASIEAKAIGRKIRRLRLKRSMGLVELGQQAGLSASFLSQLETGKVIPTIRNLARIALVFKKDIAGFFQDENETVFRVSQAKDRVRLPVGEKADPSPLSESMSLLVPDCRIVPSITEFLPGAEDAAFHPQVFSGLELVYVIQGPLKLSTERKAELLQTQDSAWIDGSVKRLYQPHEGNAARVLIVTYPMAS